MPWPGNDEGSVPSQDILNIQPLERSLKSQMVFEFQEGVTFTEVVWAT